MALSLSSAVGIAACDALTAKTEDGSAVAASYFRVYAGPPPATIRDALDGANVVLIDMEMPSPAFQPAVENLTDEVAEAAAFPVDQKPADANGRATFYRMFNKDNQPIWQGLVTAPNLGGDMELSSIDVVSGVNVVVQSFFMRVPL